MLMLTKQLGSLLQEGLVGYMLTVAHNQFYTHAIAIYSLMLHSRVADASQLASGLLYSESYSH